ncbi:class Ib ribonucleoside-diphosphate reductase assembly flavoprotein NrdI [Bacillus sp. Gen3]|nr:class Ib ribonucleoside-diphosphate reductase assembly flavoprotein NrdI [Bacillus sp. Gen3]
MIYYASLTGNVRRFIAKVGLPAEEIREGLIVTEPFVLVTYTIGFGDVPASVDRFLEENGDLLRGVAVSGNVNWGANFGKAGDIIASEYGVPLLHKFELSGTQDDVNTFKERVVQCDI